MTNYKELSRYRATEVRKLENKLSACESNWSNEVLDLNAEIERLTAEDRRSFEFGYYIGRDDADHKRMPRAKEAYSEWQSTVSGRQCQHLGVTTTYADGSKTCNACDEVLKPADSSQTLQECFQEEIDEVRADSRQHCSVCGKDKDGIHPHLLGCPNADYDAPDDQRRTED